MDPPEEAAPEQAPEIQETVADEPDVEDVSEHTEPEVVEILEPPAPKAPKAPKRAPRKAKPPPIVTQAPVADAKFWGDMLATKRAMDKAETRARYSNLVVFK